MAMKSRVPQFAIALAAALLIAQLATIGRAWLADRVHSRPTSVSARPRRVDLVDPAARIAQIVSAHIFGAEDSREEAANARPSTAGLKLTGIIGLGPQGTGYAIVVTPDGRSGLYRAGQSISAGIALHEIMQDYVTLTNGSQLERLALPRGPGGALLASVRASDPSATGDELTAALTGDTRSTLNVYGLSVVQDSGGNIVGLSGKGSEIWQYSGLQPTDVIVAIDGAPVGEVLRTQMGIDNASSGANTITVQRNGAQLDIQTQAPPVVPVHYARRG